jgi:hypothetical protein
MRGFKVVIAVICIAAACWPGSIAFGMFKYVVWPRLNRPPNMHATHYVIMHGHQLAPWQIYAIPAGYALAALGLAGGGLYLLLQPESHDNN